MGRIGLNRTAMAANATALAGERIPDCGTSLQETGSLGFDSAGILPVGDYIPYFGANGTGAFGITYEVESPFRRTMYACALERTESIGQVRFICAGLRTGLSGRGDPDAMYTARYTGHPAGSTNEKGKLDLGTEQVGRPGYCEPIRRPLGSRS